MVATQIECAQFVAELEQRRIESAAEMQGISNILIPVADTERQAREKARHEMHARREQLIKELLLVEMLIRTLDSENQ